MRRHSVGFFAALSGGGALVLALALARVAAGDGLAVPLPPPKPAPPAAAPALAPAPVLAPAPALVPGDDWGLFSDEEPGAGGVLSPTAPPGGPGQPGLTLDVTGPGGQTTQAASKPGGFQGVMQHLGLLQGVRVSGSNTLTFQANTLQGSEQAYEGQRWDTGSLVRQSALHLEGPLWKEFVFQADLSDSGWGQSYTRSIFGYMGKDSAVLFGDLDLSLGGNEFVSYRKSTRGWQLDQKLPNDGFMRGFVIQEKGLVHNQTFVGNGTTGPYFLTFTPIIEGSEMVKVNETALKSGVDYRLDYESGQLSFDPTGGTPRIINASDTISVSYQSSGYTGSQPGTIYGLRAEMPFANDRLLVGLTTLQRTVAAGATSDTVGYQEDVYNGSGSTGPFDTSFRPIAADGTHAVYHGKAQIIDKGLVVLMDAAPQTEGVNFDARRDIGRIIFRMAVPPTSLVVIKYYYSLATVAQTGDQRLWGVDVGYRVSKSLNVGLDWATSSDQGTGANGSALSATAEYTRPRLHLTGEYRDISPSYTYMDSVGFQNQSRGLNLGGDWQVLPHVSVTDRYSRLDSTQGLSFGYSGYGGGTGFSTVTPASVSARQAGTTATAYSVQTQSNDVGLRLNFRGWPDIILDRNTMSNVSGTNGTSNYTTQSARLSYAPGGGKYTATVGFTSTRQEDLAPSTTGGSPQLQGSETGQIQTSFTYNPVKALSFNASVNRSTSTALNTVNRSSSNNTQLSMRWTPSQNLSLDLSRSLSDSSGLVASNYYSGTGTGGSTTTTTNPSSSDTSDRLAINWRAGDALSLDFSLGRRGYRNNGSEGYLDDSNDSLWNLGAMWQCSKALSLNLSLGNDNMQFLDAGRGAVTSRNFILGLNYRPAKAKWSAGLTLNVQDGSSPTTAGFTRFQQYVMEATKMVDLSGQFTYNLRENLSFVGSAGVSNYTSGSEAFRKLDADLRMRYMLNPTTGVDFGYRFIRNVAGLDQQGFPVGGATGSQNYQVSTFMLALSTNFAGGIGGQNPAVATAGGGYGAGAGLGGAAGTFAGYQTGLRTGAYGTPGASLAAQTGLAGQMGFPGQTGLAGQSSFGGGMGTSGFGAGTFGGTGSTPFGGGGYPGGMEAGGSTMGNLSAGLGGFRRQERTQGAGTGLSPFGQPATAPGQPGAGPAGAVDTGDWWLLNDNVARW